MMDGGLAVSGASADVFISGFNINTDHHSDGTRESSYDITVPALFVAEAGADGILGGSGYADDDFRLQQVRGGQAADSPGVDAGSMVASRLGIGGSTAIGDLPDIGVLDPGYHYAAAAAVV